MFREFWELGFSVVPVLGKSPILKEWSKYANEAQSEELIDQLEEQYKNYGVGILLGGHSRLIGFDVDDESLANLCPPSPVRKKGKKGFTSFFQSKDIEQSFSFKGIDILYTGRQTVMPPSIHPETKKPYVWLTKDTLFDIPVNSLPELCMKDIDVIQRHFSPQLLNTGRNNRLTQIVRAMLHDNAHESNEVLGARLLEWDIKEHSSPYFADESEPEFKKAKTPLGAAVLFVSRHRTQLEKKGEISKAEVLISEPKINSQVLSYPETTGIMYAVQQAIIKQSRSIQEELALGGSIAICSALCSNKFHIEGRPAITHQYVLNVARSGTGKGAPLNIANQLLGPDSKLGKHNLIGLNNYSSRSAFVSQLPTQRTRIDFIDEFSSLLEGFSSGSVYSKEVEQTLAELYTNNGSFFKGHYTNTHGFKGSCYSPAVSLLANIQEENLVEMSKKSMIDGGLLARFIFFKGMNDAAYNQSFDAGQDLSDLINEIDRVVPFYKLEGVLPDGSIVDDIGKIDPKREPIAMPNDVKKLLREIDHDLFNRENQCHENGEKVDAIMLSRVMQKAERLCVVKCVMDDRRELSKDDLLYSVEVMRVNNVNSRFMLKSISGSKVTKKLLWIESAVKKRGFISHSALLKNSSLSSREFSELVKTAMDIGVIKRAELNALNGYIATNNYRIGTELPNYSEPNSVR